MLIFCHANGFPPNSYQELFNEIEKTPTSIPLAPLKRPFTDVEYKNNWNQYGDEFIEDLKPKATGKITAIGHSMGGVMLLRAATLHPEWFEKIILIDPTFLPELFVYVSNYLPKFINRKIHPVASKAYRRRDQWSSRQEAYDIFRQKKLFKQMSDESLHHYVNSALTPDSPNGVTLSYSKKWEEHCFLSVINVWPLLKKCQTPIVGITGEKSELMRPKIIKRWKSLAPASEIHTIKKTGHLVPLEAPKEVARIIIPHLS